MGEVVHRQFSRGSDFHATRWAQMGNLEPESAFNMELEALVANVQVLSYSTPEMPAETYANRDAQRIADRQALFGEVVEMTTPLVFSLVLKLCKYDDDLAAEAMQETYLRTWRNIDKFNGDSKFTTWLTRIALNASHDRVITHKRILSMIDFNFIGQHIDWRPSTDRDEKMSSSAEDLPDKAASKAMIDVETRQDLSEAVKKALGELSIVLRQSVVLHAIEGYSHPEIASILGIQEEASKVRYHRGMKKLRILLGPTFEEWDKG